MSELGPHPAERAPEQFVVADFDDGAVLLDLASGDFFRLNSTARCLADGLVHGESAALLAERLTHTFGISVDRAAADVQDVLAQLHAGTPGRSSNPLRFEADPGGAVLCWEGVPICHLDPAGLTVTDAARGLTSPDATQRLLWAVPHVLMLRGYFVLHAAAVLRREGVLAFCGPAGIGKTTLAHEFAKHGAVPVAEDLLLVDLEGATPAVSLSGEAALRAWVTARGSQLAKDGQVSTADLAATWAGPWAPLQEVLFPERLEQRRSVIVTGETGGAEALALLLANSFAELARPDVWRRVWKGSCRLVEHTPIRRAQIPEGLAELAEAMAAYSRTVMG